MNKKHGIGVCIVAVCAIIAVTMFTGCTGEETAIPTPAVTVTLTSISPLKTDSDNVTIEKTPWMNIVFQDPAFAFQLQRTLGYTYYGGADVEECLSTACRIKDGDFESWYEEWLKTADRVCRIADTCLANGDNVSAREAYLRASNYYRTAEFFLHGDPTDPRILETWGKSRECFIKAGKLFSPPFESIEIPYEGTTLPGYFFRVDDSDTPRPTLILQTGYDGTAEELYFGGCAAAQRRGYNCLAFEGPGQGAVIREQNLHFRPDWEKVVTPVVDYALTRPEIDPDRIALMGVSLGGYLAPRAAAYEHCIAACIANGGVFDPFEGVVAKYPEPPEAVKEYIIKNPSAFDAETREEAKSNTYLRWAMEQGMWTFGVTSPSEWMLKFANYTMKGRADKITCPTLVCDGEGDLNSPGQAKKLYDALTCPKEFMLFTVDDAAEQHCQMGAMAISHQRIFDWLDKTFAEIGTGLD
jgi:pimeloyl-ACP methyl ester carboxylesterase